MKLPTRLNVLSRHKFLVLTILIFGTIYALITFVNHYNFRTYALDLGAYTNALYDYSHFQFNDSLPFKAESENLLADHFDLYLILFSPLSYIFKSYTLLIIQWISILIGAIGIYRYFLFKFGQSRSLVPTIYFLSFFGIFGALSFDYHSNVVAAMLVPWLFLFIEKKRLIAASTLLFSIIIAKENMSFWMFFVCIALAINHWKEYSKRAFLLGSAAVCLTYFLIITQLVMPNLSLSREFGQFDYSYLGEGFSGAFKTMITSPIYTIKGLFVNHLDLAMADYMKMELHLILICCGIPLLIRKPVYLIMLIPIFFQKLYHDNFLMWGISDHYNIEFAPILTVGVFTSIYSFKKEKLIKYLAPIVLLLSIGATIRTMDNPIAFVGKERIRIYKSEHYQRSYDVSIVHQKLNRIPNDAIVSTQSPFMPHLAFRDKVYQFPQIKDAEYVVYSDFESTYPLNQDQMDEKTESLLNSPKWTIHFRGEGLTILKRNYW